MEHVETLILAIDPSCKASAYVLFEQNSLLILDKGFLEESEMLDYVETLNKRYPDKQYKMAIETMQFLGGIVGQTVFKTCILIGKILDRAQISGFYQDIREIYRKEEKMDICGTMRVNDKAIKDALVKRFAKGVPNNGKGTKAAQGWFYGFKADIWQAYSIGITYYDLYCGGKANVLSGK